MAEKEPTPAAPDQLQLALERTIAAYERTLMAWIRTSGSLITFGFALYEFFEWLNLHDPGRIRNRVLTAHTFGITMIAFGIVALVLTTLQYRRVMKRLEKWCPEAPFSFALLLAGLISLLGLLALFETVFRHL